MKQKSSITLEIKLPKSVIGESRDFRAFLTKLVQDHLDKHCSADWVKNNRIKYLHCREQERRKKFKAEIALMREGKECNTETENKSPAKEPDSKEPDSKKAVVATKVAKRLSVVNETD